jgi:hypothetical protein
MDEGILSLDERITIPMTEGLQSLGGRIIIPVPEGLLSYDACRNNLNGRFCKP